MSDVVLLKPLWTTFPQGRALPGMLAAVCDPHAADFARSSQAAMDLLASIVIALVRPSVPLRAWPHPARIVNHEMVRWLKTADFWGDAIDRVNGDPARAVLVAGALWNEIAALPAIRTLVIEQESWAQALDRALMHDIRREVARVVRSLMECHAPARSAPVVTGWDMPNHGTPNGEENATWTAVDQGVTETLAALPPEALRAIRDASDVMTSFMRACEAHHLSPAQMDAAGVHGTALVDALKRRMVHPPGDTTDIVHRALRRHGVDPDALRRSGAPLDSFIDAIRSGDEARAAAEIRNGGIDPQTADALVRESAIERRLLEEGDGVRLSAVQALNDIGVTPDDVRSQGLDPHALVAALSQAADPQQSLEMAFTHHNVDVRFIPDVRQLSDIVHTLRTLTLEQLDALLHAVQRGDATAGHGGTPTPGVTTPGADMTMAEHGETRDTPDIDALLELLRVGGYATPALERAIRDAVRRGDAQELAYALAVHVGEPTAWEPFDDPPASVEMPEGVPSDFQSLLPEAPPIRSVWEEDDDDADSMPPYAVALAPRAPPAIRAAIAALREEINAPTYLAAMRDALGAATAMIAADVRSISVDFLQQPMDVYHRVATFLTTWGIEPGTIQFISPVKFGMIARAVKDGGAVTTIIDLAGRLAETIAEAMTGEGRSDEPEYGRFGSIDFTCDPLAVLQTSIEPFAAMTMGQSDPACRVWSDIEVERIARRHYLGAIPPPKSKRQGGFAIAVDASSSMNERLSPEGLPKEIAASGITRAQAAKALALAVTGIAVRRGIPFVAMLFSDSATPIMTVSFPPDTARHGGDDARLEMVERMLQWASLTINGGTDFDGPLRSIIRAAEDWSDQWGDTRIDGIMITDGECAVSPPVLAEWTRAQEQGVRLLAAIIDGSGSNGSLESFADFVLPIRKGGDFFRCAESFGRMVAERERKSGLGSRPASDSNAPRTPGVGIRPFYG